MRFWLGIEVLDRLASPVGGPLAPGPGREGALRARAVIHWLDAQPDARTREALILSCDSLSQLREEVWPKPERAEMVGRLRQVHRDDPDAAVRSAAVWLLRMWGCEREGSSDN
jgi:hypothetical protein